MNPLAGPPHWRLLLEVERQGSIARAAESLGLDAAAASRLLRRLEASLGRPLLDRGRKPARLTSFAQSLLPYAGELARAQEALAAAVRAGCNPSGEARRRPRRIRVSIPTNTSRGVFFSRLRGFEESRPGLRLEICADTGAQGLLDGTADIALLGYTPADAGLRVMPARPSVSLLLASADYVRRHGAPGSVEELARRTVILRSSSSRAFSTRLEKGPEVFYLSPGQGCRQGDAPYCRDQLLKGAGIAIDVALSFVEGALASGEVVPVLPGWHREPWRNSVACREELADDPLCQEIMGLIQRSNDEVETGLWQHWYRRFGIALEDAGIPQGRAPALKRQAGGAI